MNAKETYEDACARGASEETIAWLRQAAKDEWRRENPRANPLGFYDWEQRVIMQRSAGWRSDAR
jgi:hypothetical protein